MEVCADVGLVILLGVCSVSELQYLVKQSPDHIISFNILVVLGDRKVKFRSARQDSLSNLFLLTGQKGRLVHLSI